MSGFRIVLLAAAAALVAAQTANADEVGVGKHAGAIIINARATDVDPVGRSPILTAAGTPTGLSTSVDSSVVPSLGISYFFSDHLAAELILATSKHTISAVGATSTTVHKTWVLPPTVTLQYHLAPHSAFSPYVGAGLNYMFFYSGRDYNGFTVRPHDGVGEAVQVGADIAINRRANVNLDLKKIFFRTDAAINRGALRSHVQIDPWVMSAGLGLKF